MEKALRVLMRIPSAYEAVGGPRNWLSNTETFITRSQFLL